MENNLCPEIQAEGKAWRFCGVWARNREEWMITLLAGMHFGITNVGFYDAMNIQAVDYILNQTKLTTIFCEPALVKKIVDMKNKGLGASLKNLVIFSKPYDLLESEMYEKGREAGLTLREFNVVRYEGEKSSIPFRVSQPDDVYIFSYTSGTTGDSKGVKLAHRNIIASVLSIRDYIPFEVDDVCISYLPYPHSFEQAMTCLSCMVGSSIGYYQGNTLKLTEDCQKLKPTFFPSVPRLYNKIFSSIPAKFEDATGCKRWLIDTALASKQAASVNAVYTSGCYDALVFNKIKDLLGGRVRNMITASAPIDLEVLDFLKICFCCPIMEAYGLTEVSGGATSTKAEDPITGHVGGPIQRLRIRLRDVPEMSYFSTDKPYPRGEVCMKGPTVFSGYFLRPDKTAEAFDKDGWFLTGDVAMIYPNGTIKIVDRSKNIFKLSQGEYIAPEKIENILVLSQYVEQSFVYGDSLKNCAVVICVPAQAEVEKFKASHPDVDVLASKDFKKLVLDDMTRLLTEHHCTSLEKPKAISFFTEPFSVDNDILTPTFKLKRNIAKQVFKEQIDAMYADLQAAGL